MKKPLIVPLAFAATLAALFTGCGNGVNRGIGGNVEMDSAKSIELVAETIAGNIDPEGYKITEAYWCESEELSNSLDLLLLYMVDSSGTALSQSFGMSGGLPGRNSVTESGKSDYDFEDIYSLTPADFDTGKIAGWIKKGKKQLPRDMRFRSVNDFNFDINPLTGEKSAFFTIYATKKGEKPTREGANTVTPYYEFSFDVAADGSVVLDNTQ
jgi:hypothetical protein